MYEKAPVKVPLWNSPYGRAPEEGTLWKGPMEGPLWKGPYGRAPVEGPPAWRTGEAGGEGVPRLAGPTLPGTGLTPPAGPCQGFLNRILG